MPQDLTQNQKILYLLSKHEKRVGTTVKQFDSQQTDESDEAIFDTDFDHSDTVDLLKQEEVVRVETKQQPKLPSLLQVI